MSNRQRPNVTRAPVMPPTTIDAPYLLFTRSEDANGHGVWMIVGVTDEHDAHRAAAGLAHTVGHIGAPLRHAMVANTPQALRAWGHQESRRKHAEHRS